MPPGVGQWVWVSDFNGFGLSDCNPRLAHTFLDLSSAHYPERLGTFMVVGAPWSAPSTLLLLVGICQVLLCQPSAGSCLLGYSSLVTSE